MNESKKQMRIDEFWILSFGSSSRERFDIKINNYNNRFASRVDYSAENRRSLSLCVFWLPNRNGLERISAPLLLGLCVSGGGGLLLRFIRVSNLFWFWLCGIGGVFHFRMLEAKMSLRKGAKVWVEDKELAWVPAEVVDSAGKQLQLLTPYGKKASLPLFSFNLCCLLHWRLNFIFLICVCLQVFSPADKLYPRDPDAEDHGGVDDMTKLTYLNEPGVLYNLERRYALNDIYVSHPHSTALMTYATKMPLCSVICLFHLRLPLLQLSRHQLFRVLLV